MIFLKKYLDPSDKSFKNSIISGSLWSIIGVFISKGLLLITWFLIARILGKNLYGEFGMIRSTIQMFSAFTGFGLGLTATKHVAEYIGNNNKKVSNILSMAYGFAIFLGLIVCVIINIFVDEIAIGSLNAPHLKNEIRIASFMVLISSLNGAQVGVLQGLKAYDVIAKINFKHGLISSIMFIVGAYFYSLAGAIWALVLSLCLLFVLNAFKLKSLYKLNHIRLNFQGILAEKRLLLSYSLPAALCGLVVSPVKWVVESSMVRTSNGFSEMGVFQASLIFQILIMTLTKTINAPIITALASDKEVVSDKKEKFNITGIWSLSLFIVVPIMLFPGLLDFVLGSDYSGKQLNDTITIIMLYTSIFLLTEGLARKSIVESFLWLSFFNNLFWGIILVSSFSFLPKTSIGLSTSYLLSYLISFFVFVPFYIRKGLVKSNVIFNKTNALYMILLFLGASMSFYENGFYIKLPFLIVFLTFIGYTLRKEYFKS